MLAALPAKAPAKPKQARKVLVLVEGRRIRALVDSARRPHHRRDGQEDRRLDDDDHVRRGRHQRGQPEAVRRDLPRQHDRRIPRRAERRGGDGGAAQGAARLRPRRQGPRRHPRRDRLVSPESSRPGGGRGRCWRASGWTRWRRPRRIRRRRAGRGAVRHAGRQERGSEDQPRGVHRARRRVVRQDGHRQVRPHRAGRLPAALRHHRCRRRRRPSSAAPASRCRRRRRSSVPTGRSAPGRSSTR